VSVKRPEAVEVHLLVIGFDAWFPGRMTRLCVCVCVCVCVRLCACLFVFVYAHSLSVSMTATLPDTVLRACYHAMPTSQWDMFARTALSALLLIVGLALWKRFVLESRLMDLCQAVLVVHCCLCLVSHRCSEADYESRLVKSPQAHGEQF
jgi:hypothetical protein